MIKWFKRKQTQSEEKSLPPNDAPVSESTSELSTDTHLTVDSTSDEAEAQIKHQHFPDNADDSTINEQTVETAPPEKRNFFLRFKDSLIKTRKQLGSGIARLLLGKKQLDQALIDDLETTLLTADFGIATTERILKTLTERLERHNLQDGNVVYQQLKQILEEILQGCEQPLPLSSSHTPFVILMVGVNGAGKTTSIGKLAKQFQQNGKKVILAAGDTFRAAAIEQLQVWGERNQISVIAQHSGADSASVIFDALQAAKARNADILIADTAGRLHTQTHLMDELKKIKRVLSKLDPTAPHEVLLVLDASIGQNALNQARQFHEAIGLTGLLMTKLDGTAKGGILFAIANELKLPIRYVGMGEQLNDLVVFQAKTFVEALFEENA